MQKYTFFCKPQLFLRIFFHFSMSGCNKIATGKQKERRNNVYRRGAPTDAGAPNSYAPKPK